jgi:hypothetical protein
MSTTTTPTATDKSKLTPVENHKNAAKHNEEAAKHHIEAAKHVEDGKLEKAAHSTIKAQAHHAIADEHHKEVVKQHAMKS